MAAQSGHLLRPTLPRRSFSEADIDLRRSNIVVQWRDRGDSKRSLIERQRDVQVVRDFHKRHFRSKADTQSISINEGLLGLAAAIKNEFLNSGIESKFFRST
ncbi:hypothetical protein ROA7450_02823 [Roseovarius albus]|uniref:Uncharacterized protein n=1 Tax=Roseovarius albus TaxID=1247867 RepID=A0A1X6ZNG2_9RHOB|nr:hypothetical protein ROA7450_02823 [Roseovarius albus]